MRLDEDTTPRLDALSARTNRSRGLYLKLALRAALPTLERLHWEQRAVEFEDKVIDRQFHALLTQLAPESDGPTDDSGGDPVRDLPLW